MKKDYYIWGILNVTPDSFSDGDGTATAEKHVGRGTKLVADGADFIDMGGESTRPGYAPVPVADELARVLPVLRALVSQISVPISLDTQKADVAEMALVNGATVVNDIWGLQGDGRMAEVIGRYGASVVIMHNRATIDPEIDIMADVARFWEKSLAIAKSAGIERVFLDPGIGFGKTDEQNWAILENIGTLVERFGPFPIFLGVSRKSFIGRQFNEPDPLRRDAASAEIAREAVRMGVKHIRVHNVCLQMKPKNAPAIIKGLTSAYFPAV
ncbi:MAG: dihydropteroate synthase [Puniceicoccales bacterium]|jgi:dihydropteroate synthase|nr:dihydropteroate synthase [Puniceicoccales bacterium]